MKKSFLLPLVLCCLLNSSAQSQHTYVPMESVTDWYVSVADLGGQSFYWNSYVGDTIIDANEYRIIQWEIAPGFFQEIFLREDVANQKVYRYRGNPDFFEHLYYDFSLDVNGILPVYFAGTWYEYAVQSLDTIPSPAGPLRRWIFDGPVGPGFWYTEAVGGSPITYESTTFISDPVYFTSCAYNGCEKIFGTDTCQPHPRHGTSEDVQVTICDGDNFLGHEIAGTYIDTLQSNSGCDSIINSSIEVMDLPAINESVELCPGEEIYGINTTGTYEIILASTSDCDTVLTLNLTILDSTDVQCLTAIKGLDDLLVDISPNPTSNLLNIEVEDFDIELFIYDFYGRKIDYKNELVPGINTLNLSNLASGVYFIHLRTPEGMTTRKVLKY